MNQNDSVLMSVLAQVVISTISHRQSLILSTSTCGNIAVCVWSEEKMSMTCVGKNVSQKGGKKREVNLFLSINSLSFDLLYLLN